MLKTIENQHGNRSQKNRSNSQIPRDRIPALKGMGADGLLKLNGLNWHVNLHVLKDTE